MGGARTEDRTRGERWTGVRLGEGRRTSREWREGIAGGTGIAGRGGRTVAAGDCIDVLQPEDELRPRQHLVAGKAAADALAPGVEVPVGADRRHVPVGRRDQLDAEGRDRGAVVRSLDLAGVALQPAGRNDTVSTPAAPRLVWAASLPAVV